MEKNSTLPAFLLSKLINEQGGFFCLLHENLQAGWKENLKNVSEHALLLGTSEYVVFSQECHIGLSVSKYIYPKCRLPKWTCQLMKYKSNLKCECFIRNDMMNYILSSLFLKDFMKWTTYLLRLVSRN